MRELTSHKVSGLNEELRINVLDEPGHGGANHEYQIRANSNPDVGADIDFQNGPIKEFGVNGISGEALLTIVEDRLKCFQDGQFSCRENEFALYHVQSALHWLHHRTRERLQRGVEGTNIK